MTTQNNACSVKPFWHPLVAGLALGAVLLATFVFTGHGLGATGFTTRFSAWLGLEVAPHFTTNNAYLGDMAGEGNSVLNSWITWQVLGVALGGLVSALLAGRFRVQFDGQKSIGSSKRVMTALAGGLMAGFGARISAGCTSGLGLSGAATLSIAGFCFLITFFVTGLIVSRIVRGL